MTIKKNMGPKKERKKTYLVGFEQRFQSINISLSPPVACRLGTEPSGLLMHNYICVDACTYVD